MSRASSSAHFLHSDMDVIPFPKFATNAIHIGNEPERNGASHDLVTPISLAVTFGQIEPGVFKVHDYARGGNPTRDSVERSLAAAENAAHTVTFSSGTGALSAIMQLIGSGDEVVSMASLYGGTYTYFDNIATKNGIRIVYLDVTDADKLHHALSRNTRMVYLESPVNPSMRVIDIEAVVRSVKGYNKDIITVLDNSFTTPYFLRPLDLGVDISYQSVSKYMGGHADVMMGSASVNSEDLANRLKYLQNNMGAIPSPFDCYLILRSLKTLHIRMREHMKNGLLVAKFLERHPCVEKVNHPGLPSHPNYELFKKQSRGCSGIFSFYLSGGKTELFKFFRHLKIFTVAASFGGCESVCSFPTVMSHKGVQPKVLQAAGVTDNLARLSIGLEDVEDLMEDLDQALWSSGARKGYQQQQQQTSPTSTDSRRDRRGSQKIKIVNTQATQTGVAEVETPRFARRY
ncbi:Cystathionine gamma-lyase [Hypsibius exemplaris]|uniref:cystathionine gamma-lyase n=1 Tax=Hypsibius exemplaris TaxID=2072580 RepID=A0A1W0X3Z8_HYPEX|nr:Cystathionine gamma-lyase [Hypsibius exemplaris]